MEKLCSKQNQFGQISEATLAKVSAKDLWDMVFLKQIQVNLYTTML